MTTIADATGALHDTTDGRFAGHLKAETDTAVLNPPANALTIAEAEAEVALQAAAEVERQAVRSMTAASLKGAVATAKQAWPDLTGLVLVNNDEGGWRVEIARGGSQETEPAWRVGVDDNFEGDPDDAIWQWASNIDTRRPLVLAEFCVGFDPASPWAATGLETLRNDDVARAEIRLDMDTFNVAELLPELSSKPRTSIGRLRTEVKLLDGIDREAKVAFQREEDADVVEGTIRHGAWTAEGQIAGRDIDPRDAHVRITTRSGVERWMPFAQLADLHEAGSLGLR